MARIDRIAQAVRSVGLGATLIDFGVIHNVDIVLDSELDRVAYYQETLLGSRELLLNPAYNDEMLIVAAAHELRHVE